MVVGESAECGIEHEPVTESIDVFRTGVVGPFRSIVLVDRMQCWASIALAELVERCVRGDPVGPGAERRSAVETRQVANDLDQRLLAGVVGVAGAPGDATTHGMDAVVVATQELIERETVTALCGGDQGSVIERVWNDVIVTTTIICRG